MIVHLGTIYAANWRVSNGATRILSNVTQHWTRENNPKGTALATCGTWETDTGELPLCYAC